jgi:hypothetical protein
MRYRLMASYLGASYQAAVGPSDRDVTLFAAPPPPEEHGFSPAPGGIWRKQVRLDDLGGLWESRPIGSYHGEPCLVLDDLGDRVHIVYLGMDERRAAQLGYWEVDRGVFEVVVPRHDVSDLAEERHEFPIALLLAALPALPRAIGAGSGGPGSSANGAGPGYGVNGGNMAPAGASRAIGAIGAGSPAGAVQVATGAPGGPGPGGMPGWNGQAGPQARGQLPAAMPGQPAGPPQPGTGGYQVQPGQNGMGQNGMGQNGMGQNGMGQPPASGMPGVPGPPNGHSVPGAAQRVDAPQPPGGQLVPAGPQFPATGQMTQGAQQATGAAPLPGQAMQYSARPGLPLAQLPSAQPPAAGPGAQPQAPQPPQAQQFSPAPPAPAAPQAAGPAQFAPGQQLAGQQQGGQQQASQQAMGQQAGTVQAMNAQAQAAQPQAAQPQAPQVQQQLAAPTAVTAWHGSPDGNGGHWYYQPGPDPQQNGTAAGGYPANGAGYAANGAGYAANGIAPNGYPQHDQGAGPPGGQAGMQQYAQPAQPSAATGYQQAPAVQQPQYGQPAQVAQPPQQLQGPAFGQPFAPPGQQQPGQQQPGLANAAEPGGAGGAVMPAAQAPAQPGTGLTGTGPTAMMPSAPPQTTAPMTAVPQPAPPQPVAATLPPLATEPVAVPPAAQRATTQPLPAPPATIAPEAAGLTSTGLTGTGLTGTGPPAASATGPLTIVPPVTGPPAPQADQGASHSGLTAAGALGKLTGAVRGRRAARKPRLAMSAIFADLVDMADIPRSAYAVDEEITGAMCLFKTDGGYEVFSCAEDARTEVRFFEEEEAAYFYLFGVLAAEALRNGRLSPRRG